MLPMGLPMGSIFFSLTVAFFTCFLYIEIYSTSFDDMDTNILRVCVHLLLIVQLNVKLYVLVSYFGNFLFLPPTVPNKNPRKT